VIFRKLLIEMHLLDRSLMLETFPPGVTFILLTERASLARELCAEELSKIYTSFFSRCILSAILIATFICKKCK